MADLSSYHLVRGADLGVYTLWLTVCCAVSHRELIGQAGLSSTEVVMLLGVALLFLP